jgi:transcriptional regulator with XRE-family HTH domain
MYLCNVKKIAPSRAAVDAGISKSLVTKWKTNRTEMPSPEILQKLSAYFNVPVSDLISEESKQKENSISEDNLTDGERMLLEIFRQIPAEMQIVFLEQGRAFANSLKKG